MQTVTIGKLKNNLSAYLRKVRAGEEIIIRDRQTPIARLMPLDERDLEAEERELVAKGILKLPKEKMDWDAFWKIGRGVPLRKDLDEALARVIAEERDAR